MKHTIHRSHVLAALVAIAASLPSSILLADTTISSSTIVNGGALTVTAPGLLTIEGSSSPTLTFTNAATSSGVQSVIVGGSQSGNLVITGGSSLSTIFGGTIGSNSGSIGIVTVSGEGSQWAGGNGIIIGLQGTASLFIRDAAFVQGHGQIGSGTLSTGVALLSGEDTQWDARSGFPFDVGVYGTATLEIEDGATLRSNGGNLAHYGGNGAATISGTGSSWNAGTAQFYVGNGGTGSLHVIDGGSLSTGAAFIAGGTDRFGTATIAGAGSTWNVGSFGLHVGYGGTGSLAIVNGGQLVNTASAQVGTYGNGTVTLSGAGSLWSNSFGVFIGGGVEGPSNAPGRVLVTDGATLSVGQTLKLFEYGTLTLNGGTIHTHSFDHSVGTFSFRDGSLIIDGGTYTQASGVLSLGNAFIGPGDVYVTEPTFKLQNGATTSGIEGITIAEYPPFDSETPRLPQLAVLSGSALNNNGNLTIHYSGGADDSGYPIVSGVGSVWSNSGTLSISAGGIKVLDGGALITGDALIGTNGGAASVTVSGAGSTWTSSGHIYLGPQLAGGICVLDGGHIVAETSHIGAEGGVNGALLVSGVGSRWETGAFYVGEAGLYDGASAGLVNLLDGGQLKNSSGYLGYAGTATGTATVSGAGSKWDSGDYLAVGYQGNGSLSILDGGQVTNTWGVIGASLAWDFSELQTGSVTVSGASSTWINSYQLAVGLNHQGTLAIENGGGVHSGDAWVGSNNASGYVTISGSSSAWFNTNNLTLGSEYSNGFVSGNVAVVSGGTLSVGGTLKLWENGTLTLNGGTVYTHSFERFVSGYTELFEDGTLIVDGGTFSQPDGLLLIANGSNLNALPTLVLTNGATTQGIQDLWVGPTNHAAVVVSAGAVLDNNYTVSGPFEDEYYGTAILGKYSGTSGTVTVTGIGSTWNSRVIVVGENGQGIVNVLDGGHVVSTYVTLGQEASSTATVTVSGSGSTWDTQSLNTFAGQGTLNILDGGRVNANFGDAFATTINVAGAGSTLSVTGWAMGAQHLHLTDGGTVNARYSYINGTSTISGAGSALWLSSGLNVFSNGSLLIQNGGTVYDARGGGFNQSINGVITVGNGGTFNVGEVTEFGGIGYLELGETGVLNIQSGGSMYAYNLNITQGQVNFTGGDLHVDAISGNTLNVGGHLTVDHEGWITLNVVDGGTVSGRGRIDALVVNDGGAVSPGNSPGTLNSGTTTWNNGAKYIWEINALEDDGGTAGFNPGWDLWNTGDLTIAGLFTVELHSLTSGNLAGALAGWNPSSSHSWLIATSGNGAFGSLTGLSVDTSFFGSFNALAGAFSFFSTDGNDLYLNYAAVPEPSSLLLASIAAAGIGWRTRRRFSARLG